ncbi:MAG: DUF547 domain-containing protein [Chitinophagales bacterium]
MKTISLSNFIFILSGLFLLSCNSSVDKSAAKGDAMKMIESLDEEPQAESATTLTANEESSNLELETEQEASQEEGEIVELTADIDSPEEMTPTKITEENSNITTTPPESKLSSSYTKEEEEDLTVKTNTEKDTKKKGSTSKAVEKNMVDNSEPSPKEKLVNAPLKSLGNVTNGFLKKYVSGGLVSYKSIKKGEIKQLAEQIAAVDLSKSSSLEKQAFYINSYNILVVKSLLDTNIPSSPLDVLGFFDARKHPVAGQSLTLDELEKGKLFGLKKDARFHFAAVCGAKGCPQIETFAYSPSNLNAQLNRQTKKALNNTSFTRVNETEKKVELSEIFKWYESDFTQGGKSVIEYINQYRNTPIPTDYAVTYYPYDWKVNKK